MTFNTMLTQFDRAWRARLSPVTSQARAVWQQRTPREQALLRGAGLLVGALLLWTIGLRPALHTVQQARQQLPVLQAQATQLDAILLEAQALGRGRSGAMPAGDTERALQASLRSVGLDTFSALSRPETTVPGETQWQVRFTNAPAGRIVEWMANLPFVVQVQTRHVELARSNVDGRDRPGQLSGVIVLALTPQEAS